MSEELELNQVENSEENLFDDVEETVEETPTETETVEEVKSEEPFLTIKYNKEDVNLTKEEAIELSQMGKNYAKLHDKYDSVYAPLEKLAKQNGMTVENYLTSLNDTQRRFETSKEVRALKDMYPDADDSLINELAEARLNKKYEDAMNRTNEEAQALNDSKKAEVERQLDNFHKVYPNLKADELDNKVYELMDSGLTLLESYTVWANSQKPSMDAKTESRLKTVKLNEENKKRSLGNISTSGDVSADDFMKGFLG